MVGLLELYSNHAHQGERIRELLTLPKRQGVNASSRVVQSRRRATRAECEEMVVRYQAGESIRAIGQAMGFNRETVSLALHRARIVPRYHQRVAVDLALADELAKQGLNLTEIAKAMGIGRTTSVRTRRTST